MKELIWYVMYGMRALSPESRVKTLIYYCGFKDVIFNADNTTFSENNYLFLIEQLVNAVDYCSSKQHPVPSQSILTYILGLAFDIHSDTIYFLFMCCKSFRLTLT